jgi:branched-chain amino acid transport system permease protein
MSPRVLKQVLAALAALLVLAFPQAVQSSYWLNLVNLAMSFSVACLGLNIVLGYAGQISFSQAAFWGVGAYTSALLSVNLGVPVWLGLPAAFVIATLFGICLGIPTLKLSGHYLAMTTIGFGIILQLILINAIWLTGGSDGIPKIPSPWIGSLELKDPSSFYYVAVLLLALCTWASVRLKDSRVGRAFLAIQGNEMAAGTAGIDTTLYKVMAFALSAGYAGIGGWMFAHSGSHYISPDTFSFDQSIVFVAMMVLGGNGSAAGSILGAMLLTLIPEILRFLKDYYMMVYAAGIVVVMIYMPGGIMALVHSLNVVQRLRVWWRGERAAVQAPAGASETSLLPPVAAPPDTSGALLTVRGLAKHFGGLKAVDGVDLVVRRGEIQALIGPNGSGKTTIINMLSGLYVPTAGEIVLDGVNLTGRKPHIITAHGVARTFQNIRLFGDLTVLDNVLIGQHSSTKTGMWGSIAKNAAQKAEEAAMREKALKVIEFVGLRGQEHAEAKSLPYGRQRMLELARALVCEPKLLLLDEPAAGLNAAETEDLLDLLFKIRDHGITVLLIEHDMSLVMNVSDHLTVLNFGKKIAEGNAEAIQKNQEVIDAYLGTEMEVANA